MTSPTLKKKKNRKYNAQFMNIPPCRLVILAAIASFSANWSFAFQITYVNTSVDTFYSLAKKAYKEYRECNSCQMPEPEWLSQWSILVGMFYPGTICGFLLVPFLTNWIGVKKSQGVMCLAATLGVIVHFAAVEFLYLGETMFVAIVCIGRFMIGLQAGSSLCLLPLYIIEISPPIYRSFLNNFQQVSQSLSTLLGLVLGSEEILTLGSSRYTIMQLAAVIPIIFLLFLLIITPPTPSYLKNFKPECIHEGMKSRMFYFGIERIDSYRPLMGNHDINENNNHRKTAKYGQKSWRDSFKGFLIGAVVACSYAFTGDDLIDTFSSNMLIDDNSHNKTHKSNDSFAIFVSDGLGLVLFVASLIGVFLADQYGRRRLVLIGLFGTCIANIGAVVFTTNKVVVAFCFAATKTFIGMGCGGPAWFITSELVVPEYAWIFQPMSTGILLASTMLETFFYLSVDSLIGSYSLLLMTAVPALISAILIFLFLPETKGRSSEEIQYLLNATKFSGIHSKKVNVTDYYGTFEECILSD